MRMPLELTFPTLSLLMFPFQRFKSLPTGFEITKQNKSVFYQNVRNELVNVDRIPSWFYWLHQDLGHTQWHIDYLPI